MERRSESSMTDSGEVVGERSTSSRRESAVRASPEESDAMAALMRGVSWGCGDNVRVVRSGECACGEEEGGSDCEDASLSSSALGGAARTTALSTISSTSSSVKRSRTCTLDSCQERTHNGTFTHRHRWINALFNSNDGFSVVAPIIFTPQSHHLRLDVRTFLYTYLYETTLDEWDKCVLRYRQRKRQARNSFPQT